MKTCTKCKQSKPLSRFYPSKTGTQGRHPWCKACFKDKREEGKKAEYDTILKALEIMKERNEKGSTA